MYPEKTVPRRFPKAPIERRASAFLIDFVAVWLVSSFFGTGIVRWLVFLVTWLALRVVAVEKNEGQSLGNWALDMKILELRSRRIPSLQVLFQREGILGMAALFAMIGFELAFVNLFSTILLVSPLAAVCGVAVADEEYQQGIHDRIAGTVMIQSRRGFSLDLRLKKLVAELRYRMRK